MTAPLHVAGLVALTVLGASVATPARAQEAPCADCLSVRVGPATVVRGPFPDELDAPFTALKLPDGTFRGFSANGQTYEIEGPTLFELVGERHAVLAPGAAGSIDDCGRWLTTAVPDGDQVLGFVHQEQACDYNRGRTHKSMAMMTSSDLGLTWTDLGTVITGTDGHKSEGTTGEGDCTMVDGQDSYLYAYCLRASDWQTIVARAPLDRPTKWLKYRDGDWTEPGIGGDASAIGFLGPGAAYMTEPGWVAAIASDPWFGGVRLSLSSDKTSFFDLKEPLVPFDSAEWDRPAETELVAYGTLVNPANGSNTIADEFLLAYIYVPPKEGFESRYLVLHDVKVTVGAAPVQVQTGLALTRRHAADIDSYVTSTGPVVGFRRDYGDETFLAYMLTRAPDDVPSVKIAECSLGLDQMIAADGECLPGYNRERTAGWLFAKEQSNSVPVYLCINPLAETHFASVEPECEGLGDMKTLLGYGLAL